MGVTWTEAVQLREIWPENAIEEITGARLNGTASKKQECLQSKYVSTSFR
jgi:hypothetical protein